MLGILKKKKDKFQIAIKCVCAFVMIFILSFISLKVGASFYANKTIPGQSLNGVNLSAKTFLELEFAVNEIVKLSQSESTSFNYKGTNYKIPNKELGIKYLTDKTLAHVTIYPRTPDLIEFFKDSISTKNILPVIEIDKDLLVTALRKNIPSLKISENAHFALSDAGNFVIAPEKDGVEINAENLVAELMKKNSDPIKVEVEVTKPNVVVADLEKFQKDIIEFAKNPIILTYEKQDYPAVIGLNPEAIEFYRDEKNEISLKFNNNFIKDFIKKQINEKVYLEPEKLSITFTDEKVNFSGSGLAGRAVDFDEVIAQLDKQLNTNFGAGEQIVQKIITKDLEPIVKIDPTLQEKGIRELIAVGFTTYYGSPNNRLHNINNGVATFNGIIVPKGEIFSFTDNLGEVEASTGYLPELVIKPEGTIPEFGGGLCQVSSTLYRAAILGGLDIVERFPHTYAVSYYSQVLGYGLDATIYPGSKDIKFRNDTEGDILIQSFTNGPEATFRFFGTSDGRKVEMDGPYLSNYIKPGPPEYIIKPTRPAGFIKQLEKAHTGFSALWYRTVTFPDGTSKKDTITSKYRAVPSKFEVSTDKAPQPQPQPPVADINAPPTTI